MFLYDDEYLLDILAFVSQRRIFFLSVSDGNVHLLSVRCGRG